MHLVRISELWILHITQVLKSILVPVFTALELTVTLPVPRRKQPTHGQDARDERAVEPKMNVERVEVSSFPLLLED